ncbi:LHFPL tetraspan subfamily member 7 protein [Dromaius novaehollandiae]|uniref:LHFPL tetraspan subfamily member 7 protein n=1 Tax=Dromaius novaehollandiae TaxID=8790 RepID=UPI00311E2888
MLSRPGAERGAGAARPAGSLPRRPRMCSGVGCFWALLSAGLLAACAAAFLSPAWLLPPGRAAAGFAFGLLWRCAEPPRGCHGSAGPGRFADIPSGSWQASAVLCAGGCALLALGALLALLAVLLPAGACERRACILAGYVQTAAVFIMASGLLVYPFGFNSATVKRFCENSDIYYAGDCQIGWGYMLAIVGVMLSVFLPFFAKYAPKEHISPTPIPTIL